MSQPVLKRTSRGKAVLERAAREQAKWEKIVVEEKPSVVKPVVPQPGETPPKVSSTEKWLKKKIPPQTRPTLPKRPPQCRAAQPSELDLKSPKLYGPVYDVQTLVSLEKFGNEIIRDKPNDGISAMKTANTYAGIFKLPFITDVGDKPSRPDLERLLLGGNKPETLEQKVQHFSDTFFHQSGSIVNDIGPKIVVLCPTVQILGFFIIALAKKFNVPVIDKHRLLWRFISKHNASMRFLRDKKKHVWATHDIYFKQPLLDGLMKAAIKATHNLGCVVNGVQLAECSDLQGSALRTALSLGFEPDLFVVITAARLEENLVMEAQENIMVDPYTMLTYVSKTIWDVDEEHEVKFDILQSKEIEPPTAAHFALCYSYECGDPELYFMKNTDQTLRTTSKLHFYSYHGVEHRHDWKDETIVFPIKRTGMHPDVINLSSYKNDYKAIEKIYEKYYRASLLFKKYFNKDQVTNLEVCGQTDLWLQLSHFNIPDAKTEAFFACSPPRGREVDNWNTDHELFATSCLHTYEDKSMNELREQWCQRVEKSLNPDHVFFKGDFRTGDSWFYPVLEPHFESVYLRKSPADFSALESKVKLKLPWQRCCPVTTMKCGYAKSGHFNFRAIYADAMFYFLNRKSCYDFLLQPSFYYQWGLASPCFALIVSGPPRCGIKFISILLAKVFRVALIDYEAIYRQAVLLKRVKNYALNLDMAHHRIMQAMLHHQYLFDMLYHKEKETFKDFVRWAYQNLRRFSLDGNKRKAKKSRQREVKATMKYFKELDWREENTRVFTKSCKIKQLGPLPNVDIKLGWDYLMDTVDSVGPILDPSPENDLARTKLEIYLDVLASVANYAEFRGDMADLIRLLTLCPSELLCSFEIHKPEEIKLVSQLAVENYLAMTELPTPKEEINLMAVAIHEVICTSTSQCRGWVFQGVKIYPQLVKEMESSIGIRHAYIAINDPSFLSYSKRRISLCNSIEPEEIQCDCKRDECTQNSQKRYVPHDPTIKTSVKCGCVDCDRLRRIKHKIKKSSPSGRSKSVLLGHSFISPH